ncbi:TetR/AcrR family transcriptional regulator [Actinoallomurus sp. NPDC052274]|uniref:TetR/AcrR family transcriptional regulator n=1 Tax=Actinoallomurus sp. NPDC052274 TaxID=3155420 RepID=UPI0034258EB8
MTTVWRLRAQAEVPTASGTPASDDPGGFRRRLLDGLSTSIVEKGYRNTTVADVVRRARTSRRTFYEHFTDKDECFIALLTAANAEMIRQISAAVDQTAPWPTQVRQAVETWIACAESEPAIMLSWIRDVPSLGDAARRLQREVMEAFITVIQTLCDTAEWRAAGAGPASRQVVVMLLGGLRELTATTVEDGGRIGDITEVAVRSSIALLAPRTSV